MTSSCPNLLQNMYFFSTLWHAIQTKLCTLFALYCVLLWLSTSQFYPHLSGLLHWQWLKQPWKIWVNRSGTHRNITTTKQSTTQPCAYCGVHCIYHQIYNIRHNKSQKLMFLVLSCSCLCPIHWSQVLSREWRSSSSSTDRHCSNYIWVINNFISD